MTEEIKTSFEYLLTQPIEYSENGNFEQGKLLVLTAPNMKQAKYAGRLRQHYEQAKNEKITPEFVEMINNIGTEKTQKKQNEEKQQQQEIDFIIQVLYSSKNNNIENIYDIFKALLCDGVCKIEKKIEFKNTHFDQMALADVDALLGGYLYHFLAGANQ